ncbi:MAG: HRDC domain-containing protein [Thermodesulfobacteriota bacterium]|nr:HRDC domain-containing protein [Thermodesulfobacteriota bacterium]
MQYKFFRVSAVTPGDSEEDFNRFLRSNRVLNVNREFVEQGENSYWAMAVEYLTGEPATPAEKRPRQRNRVDYRQLLKPEDFVLFAKLRDWRKKTGEKEAVPLYTIFTNEQLAGMAQLRVSSRNQLAEIDGVGKGRLDKYADAVLAIIAERADEKGGEPISTDC